MREIFENYGTVRGEYLDGESNSHLLFTENIIRKNYGEILSINKSIKILDIGCNKGYFLKVMENHGFQNLTGIDLSQSDIVFAKKLLKRNATILETDLFEYLSDESVEKYDLIWCKAVQEHITKEKQVKFIKLLANKLAINGVAYVSVPNMDWFGSTHERYMDFTHEIGFTKESLGDIYRFSLKQDDYHIEIRSISYDFFDNSVKTILKYHLVIRPLRKLIQIFTKAIGSGMDQIDIYSRAIAVKVVRKR